MNILYLLDSFIESGLDKSGRSIEKLTPAFFKTIYPDEGWKDVIGLE